MAPGLADLGRIRVPLPAPVSSGAFFLKPNVITVFTEGLVFRIGKRNFVMIRADRTCGKWRPRLAHPGRAGRILDTPALLLRGALQWASKSSLPVKRAL